MSFDPSNLTLYGVPLETDVGTSVLVINAYLDEDYWVSVQEIFSIEVLLNTNQQYSLDISPITIFDHRSADNRSFVTLCESALENFPSACTTDVMKIYANIFLEIHNVIYLSPTQRVQLFLALAELLEVCPFQITLHTTTHSILNAIMKFGITDMNDQENCASITVLIACDTFDPYSNNIYSFMQILNSAKFTEKALNVNADELVHIKGWAITSSMSEVNVQSRRLKRQVIVEPPIDDSSETDLESESDMSEVISLITLEPSSSPVDSINDDLVILTTQSFMNTVMFSVTSSLKFSSQEFLITDSITLLTTTTDFLSPSSEVTPVFSLIFPTSVSQELSSTLLSESSLPSSSEVQLSSIITSSEVSSISEFTPTFDTSTFILITTTSIIPSQSLILTSTETVIETMSPSISPSPTLFSSSVFLSSSFDSILTSSQVEIMSSIFTSSLSIFESSRPVVTFVSSSTDMSDIFSEPSSTMDFSDFSQVTLMTSDFDMISETPELTLSSIFETSFIVSETSSILTTSSEAIFLSSDILLSLSTEELMLMPVSTIDSDLLFSLTETPIIDITSSFSIDITESIFSDLESPSFSFFPTIDPITSALVTTEMFDVTSSISLVFSTVSATPSPNEPLLTTSFLFSDMVESIFPTVTSEIAISSTFDVFFSSSLSFSSTFIPPSSSLIDSITISPSFSVSVDITPGLSSDIIISSTFEVLSITPSISPSPTLIPPPPPPPPPPPSLNNTTIFSSSIIELSPSSSIFSTSIDIMSSFIEIEPSMLMPMSSSELLDMSDFSTYFQSSDIQLETSSQIIDTTPFLLTTSFDINVMSSSLFDESVFPITLFPSPSPTDFIVPLTPTPDISFSSIDFLTSFFSPMQTKLTISLSPTPSEVFSSSLTDILTPSLSSIMPSPIVSVSITERISSVSDFESSFPTPIEPDSISLSFVETESLSLSFVETVSSFQSLLASSIETESPSPSPFETESPSPSLFETESPSPSLFETESPSPSLFETESPSPSLFETESPTQSPFETESPSPSLFETESPSPSLFETESPSQSLFETESPTQSPFETESPSPSPFDTESPSPSPFETETPSPSLMVTESPSLSQVVESVSPSPSPIETESLSPSLINSTSPTPSSTMDFSDFLQVTLMTSDFDMISETPELTLSSIFETSFIVSETSSILTTSSEAIFLSSDILLSLSTEELMLMSVSTIDSDLLFSLTETPIIDITSSFSIGITESIFSDLESPSFSFFPTIDPITSALVTTEMFYVSSSISLVFSTVSATPSPNEPLLTTSLFSDMVESIFPTVTSEIAISSTFDVFSIQSVSPSIFPSPSDIISSILISSSEIPSIEPSPSLTGPILLNPLSIIVIKEGQPFYYSIPFDTFFDIDDGFTDNLDLTLHSTSWAQLTERNVIEFLPLSTEVNNDAVTDHSIEITFQNSKGESTSEFLQVRVIPQQPLSNFVQIFIEGNFTSFNQNLSSKLDVVSKLIGTAETTEIFIGEFTSGSIAITYSNLSIPNFDCSMFVDWFTSVYVNGDYTSEFKSRLSPYILTGIPLIIGTCSGAEQTAPIVFESIMPSLGSVGGSISERVIWLAVVIPALLIGCLLLVGGVILFVNYRRRRSERDEVPFKQTYLKRKPITLPGEVEALPYRSRKPCILTDDLPRRGYTHLLHEEDPQLVAINYLETSSDEESDEELVKLPELVMIDDTLNLSPPPYRLPPQHILS